MLPHPARMCKHMREGVMQRFLSYFYSPGKPPPFICAPQSRIYGYLLQLDFPVSSKHCMRLSFTPMVSCDEALPVLPSGY